MRTRDRNHYFHSTIENRQCQAKIPSPTLGDDLESAPTTVAAELLAGTGTAAHIRQQALEIVTEEIELGLVRPVPSSGIKHTLPRDGRFP